MEKKVILSGIQATGDLHLGHYIGVLKRFVEMQEEFNCYYMVANLHALTVRRNPEELRNNCYKLLATYLACGLDPQRSTIFLQSQVPEHAELGWVLDCYTYTGELSRMTQFKDKSSKHADNINAGLFTYPSLMAGDILLYQADLVPTGEDQKQHVELTRDIAQRFNNLYGETFKIPEVYIPKVGARIMGLQNPTSKMSKSAEDPNDKILLSDEPDVIRKKLKKAVTDSDNCVKFDVQNKPGVSNLMSIYGIIENKSMGEIEREFEGKGYGIFKSAVAESIISRLEPLQAKYNELINNPDKLKEIYDKGAKKANEKVNSLLKEVYKKVGLIV